MSIIRLSILNDGIYATDQKGNIVNEDFSARRGKDRRGEGKIPLYGRGRRPTTDDPLWRYLQRSSEIEASRLPDGAPVAILVHGFLFDPAVAVVSPPHHHKADNPHARLYHFETHELAREMRSHSTSWPLGLGFSETDAGEHGLCIAVGWYSSPGLYSSLFEFGKNHYQKAYENAEKAAWELVCIAEILATILRRPIDIFCHSLGSRVVVRAMAMAVSPLPDLAAKNNPEYGEPVVRPVLDRVSRVIILAGSEYIFEARLMLSYLNSWASAVNADNRMSFYNFVSRENDVLDKLAENFGPVASGSKEVIGHNGLEARDPSWIDIQLDDYDVAAWFSNHSKKFKVSGDDTSGVFAVLDHWIHFTWPDNMRLYKDILRARDDWRIEALKANAPHLFDRTRLNRGRMRD